MLAERDWAREGAFIERVHGHLAGAATVLMAHLGDRLGLYRALATEGPATPGELGSRTGYAERYLREWLAQQAAVGFIAYDAGTGRFALPAEHRGVLGLGEPAEAYTGAFEVLTGWYVDLDTLAADFPRGDGVAWGNHDPRVHSGTARFFGAAYRAHLLSEWVPALGLDAVLRRGARVADVGCGHGVSTVLLATGYPESRFVGFDAHAPSIEAARGRAAEAGVADRVSFEVADARSFGGGPYEVIWFFDTLHDLGDPAAAATNARRNLAEGGTVALVEPFAYDDLPENLTANPAAALHYTASTFLCVPHALSEPGQAALGGQAGGRRLADVLRQAGLAQVERVTATPLHAVYAARP